MLKLRHEHDAPADHYQVYSGEVRIGTIYKTSGNPSGNEWFWGLNGGQNGSGPFNGFVTIAILYVGLRCHDRGRRRDWACAAARLVGETFGVSNEPIWVRPVAAALMATPVKAADAPQSMLTRTPSALAQTRNIEAATRPRLLSLASSIESNTAALDFGKCGSQYDRYLGISEKPSALAKVPAMGPQRMRY